MYVCIYIYKIVPPGYYQPLLLVINNLPMTSWHGNSCTCAYDVHHLLKCMSCYEVIGRLVTTKKYFDHICIFGFIGFEHFLSVSVFCN